MTLSFDSSTAQLALLASVGLAVVAVVYLLMGLGVRRGDMVWGGWHPRRLPDDLRGRSLLYAFLLVLSAVGLLVIAGGIQTDLIADRWFISVGFVVTVFLGLAGLTSLFKGSTWERVLFAPIVLASAVLAATITFG